MLGHARKGGNGTVYWDPWGTCRDVGQGSLILYNLKELDMQGFMYVLPL